MKFISTKCPNMNRGAPSGTNTGATDPPVSKKKKDTAEKHAYPALKIPPCDNLAYTRNMRVIQDELAKNRPSYKKMSQCYAPNLSKQASNCAFVWEHCAVNFHC